MLYNDALTCYAVNIYNLLLIAGLFQCRKLTDLDGHKHNRTMSTSGAAARRCIGILIVFNDNDS